MGEPLGAFVRVTGTADLKPGQGIVVEVSGKTLALFNVDGIFHAIDNTCIHRGGLFGEGDFVESVVTNPWHRWQYDVTSYPCMADSAAKVERCQVQIAGTDVKVPA